MRLNVANDLSSASGRGAVRLTCLPNIKGCSGGDVHVSFAVHAVSAADFDRSHEVSKFGSCKTVDRKNFRTRTAQGTATINGQSLPTPASNDPRSSIDVASETTVFRNC